MGTAKSTVVELSLKHNQFPLINLKPVSVIENRNTSIGSEGSESHANLARKLREKEGLIKCWHEHKVVDNKPFKPPSRKVRNVSKQEDDFDDSSFDHICKSKF